jgi:hypothetical protein
MSDIKSRFPVLSRNSAQTIMDNIQRRYCGPDYRGMMLNCYNSTAFYNTLWDFSNEVVPHISKLALDLEKNYNDILVYYKNLAKQESDSNNLIILDEMKKQHLVQLDNLKKQYNDQLVSYANQAIEKTKKDYDNTISNLKAEYNDKIEQLKIKYNLKVGELKNADKQLNEKFNLISDIEELTKNQVDAEKFLVEKCNEEINLIKVQADEGMGQLDRYSDNTMAINMVNLIKIAMAVGVGTVVFNKIKKGK